MNIIWDELDVTMFPLSSTIGYSYLAFMQTLYCNHHICLVELVTTMEIFYVRLKLVSICDV